MDNSSGFSKEKFDFVCFRCASVIRPGERMVNMSISIETPTEDGSIEYIEGTAVSTLCFPCASILLSKAIVSDPGLMMPPEQDIDDDDDEDDEDDDIEIGKEINEGFDCFNSIDDMLESVYYGSPSQEDDEGSNSEDEENEPHEGLSIQHSNKGFRLVLNCGDGISKATSQFFTWRQIAQLLITTDPDMFGTLDEPQHQVFPRTLKRLGFHVPNWQDPRDESSSDGNEHAHMAKQKRSKGNATRWQGCHEIDKVAVCFELGRYFLQEEDWEQAINAFTRVIELDPENAFAYDRRGIAYGSAERYDEAIADFNQAINIDHTFAGAYNNRGLSYYKQYRFDEAIADYDRAIQPSPDVAVFYANRGLAHSCKGDLHLAIADYDRAIELDPTLPETHNNRGEAYAKLGQFEKAIADFEYELPLNPNDIVAYANRVWAAAISQDCLQPDQDNYEKGDA